MGSEGLQAQQLIYIFFPFHPFLLGTVLKSINDFLFQSQIDNINLFKVVQMLSSVGHKVTWSRLWGGLCESWK